MGRACILLGPPGAGKGTQAADLAARRKWAHISTGAILRDAVARGTAEGLEAKAVMESGRLVSDELAGRIVEARLKDADCREGFVLDGFPRNLEQARMLEGILARTGHTAGMAVLVAVPEAELVERLSGRRACPRCGRSYHIKFQPPKLENVCDACGRTLTQRKDDAPEAVKERFAVYARETEPLAAWCRERGILREVDGLGTPGDVAARLDAVVS